MNEHLIYRSFSLHSILFHFIPLYISLFFNFEYYFNFIIATVDAAWEYILWIDVLAAVAPEFPL